MEEHYWHLKDIVYRIKCRICGEHYTGETSQKLQSRMVSHEQSFRARKRGGGEGVRGSGVGDHFANKHPECDAPEMELVTLKKTTAMYTGKFAKRLFAESYRTKSTEE